MADDQTQRPFRATDGDRRTGPSGNDPLAELARLIGQNDPFAEFGRESGRQATAPQSEFGTAQPSDQWAPARGPAPGYAPAHPAELGDPAAELEASHPGPEYAQADLYHTETSAPGSTPHAEAEAYEGSYDDPNMAHYAAVDQDYYDDVPPRRRMGILAIAAVFALAVLGTAGAFGYRALFGSVPSGPPPVIKADTKPSKVVPAKKVTAAKLIQDRAPQAEKLVTREEKPVDLQGKPVGVFPQNQINVPAGSVKSSMPGSGVIGAEPKTVRTITIRPDQPQVASAAPTAVPATPPPAWPPVAAKPAPQPAKPEQAALPAKPAAVPPKQVTHAAPQTHTAPPAHTAPRAHHRVAAAPAPRNAPLSLSPNAQDQSAPVPPTRSAAAPRRVEPQASHPTGGYGVQVSSRRSQVDAEAAFRSLQAKYPGQLGGRQPLIRRVDLGKKGIYYRAMVGPFTSRDAAGKLCSRLKAAGGACFVQRI